MAKSNIVQIGDTLINPRAVEVVEETFLFGSPRVRMRVSGVWVTLKEGLTLDQVYTLLRGEEDR